MKRFLLGGDSGERAVMMSEANVRLAGVFGDKMVPSTRKARTHMG
jgi:hypothetical protein